MRNDRGEISIPTILIGIILIVLAGICIFMLTGENGIFVPVGMNKIIQQLMKIKQKIQIMKITIQ
jgi:hypothetical protein